MLGVSDCQEKKVAGESSWISLEVKILILVVFGFFLISGESQGQTKPEQADGVNDEIEKQVIELVPEEKKEVAEPVSEETVIPDPGKDIEDAITPEAVSPTIAGAETSRRRFNLSLQKDGTFGGKRIVVYRGDLVKISLKPVDKKYDLVIPDYNLRQEVDEVKRNLEFQANVKGRFPFFCKLCGGNKGSNSGELVVLEPKE